MAAIEYGRLDAIESALGGRAAIQAAYEAGVPLIGGGSAPVGLAAPPGVQQGVVGAADGQVTALSMSTGGALTVAFNGGTAWTRSAAGIWTPLSFAGQNVTQQLTSLPPSDGTHLVCMAYIDTDGSFKIAAGSVAVGNTNAAFLVAHAPALQPGQVPLFCFGVYNNAGSYQFGAPVSGAVQGSTWLDRRQWARGAYALLQHTSGNLGPVSAMSTAGTDLAARLETQGNPVELAFLGTGTNNTANDGVQVEVTVDISAGGPVYIISEGLSPVANDGINLNGTVTIPMAAGSHSFTLSYGPYVGGQATMIGSATSPIQMEIKEKMVPSATNGAT